MSLFGAIVIVLAICLLVRLGSLVVQVGKLASDAAEIATALRGIHRSIDTAAEDARATRGSRPLGLGL